MKFTKENLNCILVNTKVSANIPASLILSGHQDLATELLNRGFETCVVALAKSMVKTGDLEGLYVLRDRWVPAGPPAYENSEASDLRQLAGRVKYLIMGLEEGIAYVYSGPPEAIGNITDLYMGLRSLNRSLNSLFGEKDTVSPWEFRYLKKREVDEGSLLTLALMARLEDLRPEAAPAPTPTPEPDPSPEEGKTVCRNCGKLSRDGYVCDYCSHDTVY